MALDGISAAASVLQVAEMGFSLAKSIHSFVVTAKDADRELKIVAEDTRLVSVVLNRAHDEIQKRATLRQQAIDLDFEDVLQGTRNAFDQVGDFFNLLSGAQRIKLSGRLQYAFNKKEKLELLRANLEKRKTTLLVMIGVLGLGREIKRQRRNSGHIEVSKLEVQTLIRAKDDAASKYQELSCAFADLEVKIKAAGNGIHACDNGECSSSPNPTVSFAAGSNLRTAGATETKASAAKIFEARSTQIELKSTNSRLTQTESRKSFNRGTQTIEPELREAMTRAAKYSSRSKDGPSACLWSCHEAASTLMKQLDTASDSWAVAGAIEISIIEQRSVAVDDSVSKLVKMVRPEQGLSQVVTQHSTTAQTLAANEIPADIEPMMGVEDDEWWNDFEPGFSQFLDSSPFATMPGAAPASPHDTEQSATNLPNLNEDLRSSDTTGRSKRARNEEPVTGQSDLLPKVPRSRFPFGTTRRTTQNSCAPAPDAKPWEETLYRPQPQRSLNPLSSAKSTSGRSFMSAFPPGTDFGIEKADALQTSGVKLHWSASEYVENMQNPPPEVVHSRLRQLGPKRRKEAREDEEGHSIAFADVHALLLRWTTVGV